MNDFKVATFNVKNLIGADDEYYSFESYTPEEYAWKLDWLARQLLKLDADVVCFQEVFDKKYKKRAIFRRLEFTPYTRDQVRFAPNANDGEPGNRRPGLAILSRFGFTGKTTITQVLSPWHGYHDL